MVCEGNRFAGITALDRAMGWLREHLKASGAKDDTLLWYCSDNGIPTPMDEYNGHLRGSKGHLYEGGLRVPGIVEWPSVVTKPRVTATPCVTTDTCAALVTGHWTNRTGVWHTSMGRSMLRENEVTMGQVFLDAGGLLLHRHHQPEVRRRHQRGEGGRPRPTSQVHRQETQGLFRHRHALCRLRLRRPAGLYWAISRNHHVRPLRQAVR